MKDPLRSLLALLADTHLLATTFSPLMATASDVRPGAQHVPFTPKSELKELKQKLHAQRTRWEKAHASVVASDIMLLYHFTHLYSLVPCLPTLYVLCGYGTSNFGTYDPREDGTDDWMTYSDFSAAMPVVWKLLETSELLQSHEVPIWAPLSVFSAGLVVWGRAKFASRNDPDAWSPRYLDPFKYELKRMEFACAQQMSATLTLLGSAISTN